MYVTTLWSGRTTDGAIRRGVLIAGAVVVPLMATAAIHHLGENSTETLIPLVVHEHSADREPEASRCAGGLAPELELRLEPRMIVAARGRPERLDLGLVASTERAADLAYAYEIVDDQGTVMQEVGVSRTSRLTSERRDIGSFRTPELPLGYYEIRVSAAALTDDEEALEGLANLYFRVLRDGSVEPLDFNDYHALSAANLAREP